MTTSLVDSFSRLNIGPAQSSVVPPKNNSSTCSLPNGSQLKVRNMNAAEEADVKQRLERYIAAEQKLAADRKEIEDARKVQIDARKEQEDARKEQEDARRTKEAAIARAAQAQATMDANTTKMVKNLEGIAASLEQLKSKQSNNPEGQQKLEALRQKVLSAKATFPNDPALQHQTFAKLKEESVQLLKSLRLI